MIRVILGRTIQTGPDDWDRQLRTLDVEIPEVEKLLRRSDDAHGAWSFVGVEVREPEP